MDQRRGEELAGLGTSVIGELLDEIFISTAKDVRRHDRFGAILE
jgi:hypothetical protein